MKFLLITLASFISLTFCQNSTEDQTCAQQLDNWHNCKIKDLPRSSEGKLMKEKIDAIYEKCAGTMPKNCTVFWKTADECFHKELDKIDSDPQLNGAKKQTLQTIELCYQRTPNDPFADLFEELYPEMILFDDGGMKPPQQIGISGRKFMPPPQCAPTLDNLQCVSKEMAALARDSEVKKASAALRRQKRACDEKLTAECQPQSPPLWMCVDRAMKILTRQTEEAMQKCMQLKGFAILLRQSQAGTAMSAMPQPDQPLPFGTAGQPIPFTAPQFGSPMNTGGTQFLPNMQNGLPMAGLPFGNGGPGFQAQFPPQQPFDWS